MYCIIRKAGVECPPSSILQNKNKLMSLKRKEQESLTTILFLETQQSGGKSCSMGTRNCRQPSQWHSSSIIPIRLTILTMALARS